MSAMPMGPLELGPELLALLYQPQSAVRLLSMLQQHLDGSCSVSGHPFRQLLAGSMVLVNTSNNCQLCLRCIEAVYWRGQACWLRFWGGGEAAVHQLCETAEIEDLEPILCECARWWQTKRLPLLTMSLVRETVRTTWAGLMVWYMAAQQTSLPPDWVASMLKEQLDKPLPQQVLDGLSRLPPFDHFRFQLAVAKAAKAAAPALPQPPHPSPPAQPSLPPTPATLAALAATVEAEAAAVGAAVAPRLYPPVSAAATPLQPPTPTVQAHSGAAKLPGPSKAPPLLSIPSNPALLKITRAAGAGSSQQKEQQLAGGAGEDKGKRALGQESTKAGEYKEEDWALAVGAGSSQPKERQGQQCKEQPQDLPSSGPVSGQGHPQASSFPSVVLAPVFPASDAEPATPSQPQTAPPPSQPHTAPPPSQPHTAPPPSQPHTARPASAAGQPQLCHKREADRKPLNTPFKNARCLFWAEGNCKRGPDCHFMHLGEPGTEKPMPPEPPSKQRRRASEREPPPRWLLDSEDRPSGRASRGQHASKSKGRCDTSSSPSRSPSSRSRSSPRNHSRSHSRHNWIRHSRKHSSSSSSNNSNSDSGGCGASSSRSSQHRSKDRKSKVREGSKLSQSREQSRKASRRLRKRSRSRVRSEEGIRQSRSSLEEGIQGMSYEQRQQAREKGSKEAARSGEGMPGMTYEQRQQEMEKGSKEAEKLDEKIQGMNHKQRQQDWAASRERAHREQLRSPRRTSMWGQRGWERRESQLMMTQQQQPADIPPPRTGASGYTGAADQLGCAAPCAMPFPTPLQHLAHSAGTACAASGAVASSFAPPSCLPSQQSTQAQQSTQQQQQQQQQQQDGAHGDRLQSTPALQAQQEEVAEQDQTVGHMCSGQAESSMLVEKAGNRSEQHSLGCHPPPCGPNSSHFVCNLNMVSLQQDVLGSPTLQQPSRVVEPRFDPNVGVPVSLLGSQPFEGDNGEGSPPAAAPAATASMATKFVVDQEEEAQVPLAGNLQVQTHYQIQQLEQQGHVLLQGQQQQQLIGEQGQWVEQHQLQEQEHQQQQQDPDEEHFPQQDPAWHGENTQQEQQERQQDQEPVDLDDVPLIERARMLSLAARKKQSAGCQAELGCSSCLLSQDGCLGSRKSTQDSHILHGKTDEGFMPTKQQFIGATVNRAARETTDFTIVKLQMLAVQKYLDTCMEEQRCIYAEQRALGERACIAAAEHEAAHAAYKAALQALMSGVQNLE